MRISDWSADVCSSDLMHRAYRHQLDRLQSLDDAIGGQRTDAMRLPWDEVRDYFHDCDNYIGSLDTAAEKLAAEICGSEPLGQALEQALAERHGVRIATPAPGGATAALRRYDPATRTHTHTVRANRSIPNNGREER